MSGAHAARHELALALLRLDERAADLVAEHDHGLDLVLREQLLEFAVREFLDRAHLIIDWAANNAIAASTR